MCKTCKVKGCNNKHKAKGFCQKHYYHYNKHGHVPERTKLDPNEIIKYEDYAEILLYNKEGNEIARTLIDLEDVDFVKQYKWSLLNTGYIYNNKAGTLHRFVMNPSDDMIIDHINHNRLDNRKENLRICTSQQNNMNLNKRSDNTSGHTGVWFSNSKNRWIAEIRVNGKSKSRNCKTKEEAIEARKELEELYFGEFRRVDE